jgi:hypothetical protein
MLVAICRLYDSYAYASRVLQTALAADDALTCRNLIAIKAATSLTFDGGA